MTCTYTFAGPDGKQLTITGKNAFKAYLATGGLAHLMPKVAVAIGQIGNTAAVAPEMASLETARSAVTAGAIGKTVSSLIENGSVVLHETAASLPDATAQKMRGVQAITTPDGKVHIVASNVSASNAQAVMLHEIFHNGGERLIGTKAWNELMRRGNALYFQVEQASGKAREFFDKARARVNAAQRQGAVAANMQAEEFLAYAIEEYESAPASIRKWVDDMIGLVKAWFQKTFGAQLGAVTPAQLSAMAQMAVMDAVMVRRGDMAPAFSATKQTSTPAFKRWFADSKAVNDAGQPIVLYHATKSDITVFNTEGGNGKTSGTGLFMSSSPAIANTYAPRRDGAVYPVYASLQNPLIVDFANENWNAGGEGAVIELSDGTQDDLLSYFNVSPGETVSTDDVARLARQRGNDGVIIRNVRDQGAYAPLDEANEFGDIYIAFKPTQIKSAVGNNGEFDPTNPDIRYSAAPLNADTLVKLRRAAAALEAPDRGIAFQITDDGRAIVRGPADTKVPARFQRFAEENGLTLVVRRGDIRAATPMPVKYRESGALYFGESYEADGIDRTGKTRFSVSPERAETILDEANDALDGKVKDDFIGPVLGDMSLGAKLIVHPRTVAAVHKEFTPVYRTAISQMETRDKNIAELGQGLLPYNALDQAGKENVNKVLELGRLTSQTYTAEELRNGVGNPGEKSVVVMVDGKPQVSKVEMNALLTEVGEVVKLSDDEITSYLALRDTFDKALDKMRDQTLTELGFEEFVGVKDAAKAIVGTIDDNTPAETAERLRNVAAFVGEIEQAKRAGYIPFARYGDYVVTVKEKVADVEFIDDVDGKVIARGLPDSFAPDMLEMGAEETAEGWRINPNQKQAVERMTEKTVYSTKVETGLTDALQERRAQKVDDIKAVKEAIEKARAEWVGDNPNRRIVAFKAREKKSEQPVKLSDVDALAEVASIDNATWDWVRDKLADAMKAKGFRRHFFHSDNVPGYSGDFERAMADYVIGMSGYLSRREHMKRWENAVTNIGNKPKLYEYASKYRDYVNDPQEELALVRQIGFFSYISGVLASAFANLTQVPMMAVPTLAQVAPTPLVLKEIGKAYKDATMMLSSTVGIDMFDPEKAPEDVRGILKEAWAEGSFVPLETFDLMMTARQRNVGARKGVKLFNDATQVVSVAFTFAERLNRLVTFIAAARLAEKRAVQENAKNVLAGDALARSEVLRNWNAKAFAEWAVDESQYRMGKANRPTMMRGVGAAIMQFKGFMLQTFEAWYRMAALHGRAGKFAAAASVLTLGSLAGVWGLPGADDLRKLIENLYKQITDKDLDLKTELRAWIARTSGSNAVAQIVSKGASYPLGVDLTRVGMGTVAPDSPLAAAGIPFDMLIGRPKRAFEKGSTGDYLGAMAELTPNFLKHWLVAGSWALEGVRDKRGNLILRPEDLDSEDLVMKSLGFQPSIITDIRDYEYAQRRQETAVDNLKRNYTNKLAKVMHQIETTSDPDKLAKLEEQLAGIYADIDEHNATASPEQVIKITNRTLRNKLMRENDGVMATWGKERKAARGAAQELRGVFGLSQEEDE